MIELIEAHWIWIAIALVLGLVIAWYVFHASRKTRVTGTSHDVLDEGAAPAERNRALIDAPPAVARGTAESEPRPAPVTTPTGLAGTGAAVAAAADAARDVGAGDDLTRIKGVGPKLRSRLAELGVTDFAQIAAWDDAEIDRIDAQLGRFEGRIRRDNWVEQAKLLAAGDMGGFENKFGNLN